MNQQTVVDVIPIDLFTIERKTCGDTGVSMWVVIGHGDDDRTQRFDSYNTLDEAEKAYPDAVTVLLCSSDQGSGFHHNNN